ncbi:MAG: potassium transporter KefB [Armatimonadetes bacterium]|nr:potassium transporter KefB [Armatimonadota bacterium]
MALPPLGDTVVVLGLAMLVLLACHRLRVPSIVGFLLTGVVAGPHGLSLVRSVDEVGKLAEVGVVFLLFTIGMEFSLESLLRNRLAVLLGGAVQILGTLAVGALIAWRFGWPVPQAVFAGMLLSLSSTAVVLKLLQQRGEVDAADGRVIFGILILQDLAIVPMIVLAPLLAGTSAGGGGSAGWLLLKSVGALAAVVVGARWVVPALLHQVARTRDRELFLLAVVVLGLGVAWLTAAAGLSLALGAFLAGLMVGQSLYSHQALGSTLPLRDVFMSFFFVSIGMMLNVREAAAQPLTVLALVGGVLVLKALIACAGGVAAGLPLATAAAVGLSLCQIGEFSFILSEVGTAHGLLPGPAHQLFLAVSVLSMMGTPFLLGSRNTLADALARAQLPAWLQRGWVGVGSSAPPSTLRDHLLIIGLGFTGQTVARAAGAAGIPYHAIELNPNTVRAERARGHPVTYGDASQEALLLHAGAQHARVVVIALPDPATVRRVAHAVRSLSPVARIIARTRFVREIGALRDLGADEVIADEHEAAMEALSGALDSYLLSSKVPEDPSGAAHPPLAHRAVPASVLSRLARAGSEPLGGELEIRAVRVCGGSEAAGASLRTLALPERFGVTVLTLWRGLAVVADLDGETELQPDDMLVAVGRRERLGAAEALLGGSACG